MNLRKFLNLNTMKKSNLIKNENISVKTMDDKQKRRILFIYPANDGESLGIEYLSGSLRKRGHKTDLILFREIEGFERELKQNIKSFDPDFVCLSVVTDNYSWACKISRIIKKVKEIPIVFGGIQVTSCPEEVISNDFVDYAVLGEGEEAIVELVENPKNPNIKNVWFKKNGKIIKNNLRSLVQNLDLLSFPDKELFYKKTPHLKNNYWCITSRGCPFGCSYCFNHYLRKLYEGQRWLRRRSVENVIEELKIMKEKGGCKNVLFFDDCFTSDKEWLRKFIKEYKKEINLPFESISIPIFIDKEVASLLKEGGCIKVQMGVQTPIERIRKEICKRGDTNEDIEIAVNELKKQKIAVSLDHIFSLPSEKIEDYDEGLKFYIKLKPTIFKIFKLGYYPNTEIMKIGKEYKTIDEETEKKIIGGDFSSGIMLHRKEGEKKFEEIFKFIQWIPIFPRGFSRFLLRTRLYRKIPKNKYITKIPIVIPDFYTIKLMKRFFRVRKNRRIVKIKLYKSKLKNIFLGNN